MLKLLALAAATLAVTPVLADVTSLSIRYLNSDSSAPTLTTSMTSNYVTSGLSFVNSTGGSFQAFCIEPSQNYALSFKSDGVTPNFKTYTVGSFTASQATLLQGLYSSSYSSALTGSQQAGFQLAVWEIMRETSSSTLSVTEGSGNFYLKTSGLSGSALTDASNALGFATSYLTAAQNYTGSALYSLTKLENSLYQDLVVAQAVPEPGTTTMYLAGLGAVGLIARRRLRR